MSKPLKRSGFAQGLYEISATQKEEIGIIRIEKDGRKFRYSRAGASALAAGKMAVAAEVAAVVTNKAAAAYAIGSKVLALTIGSATYAENYFAGGFLQINDATGEGHQYKIASSSAVAASTAIVITLEDPIRVALTTSSEFTLLHNPNMATVESATEESIAVGVSPVPVTAAYYYWAQTRGPALVLCSGTPAVGTILTLAGTAGAVTGISTTIATTVTQPIIGHMLGTVGVDTEYKPVFLAID